MSTISITVNKRVTIKESKENIHIQSLTSYCISNNSYATTNGTEVHKILT